MTAKPVDTTMFLGGFLTDEMASKYVLTVEIITSPSRTSLLALDGELEKFILSTFIIPSDDETLPISTYSIS